MDAVIAGLVGTAVGGVISLVNTMWNSKVQASTAERQLEAQGRHAAQAATREHLFQRHSEFLEAVERKMRAANDEEGPDYVELASWETENYLFNEVAKLRLLASPTTVDAASGYVAAVMQQFNVEGAIYQLQRERGFFIPNWARASQQEQTDVDKRRGLYVECAQADLGLAALSDALRTQVRNLPALHPDWCDWRDRDAYYTKLAETRLAKLLPASGEQDDKE
ncbi:hypothetical protein EDD41_2719 [Luteococcus japonicus]|uniref:Uncharacterized protein n=1 Tax=Luteococcus japonicus TaxID=33984 RepID=A0A3N1ZX92_9ACTN|nr:hypothetical protein [Luteococcus japonicus]ROR55445.1 hypothetical protein EDD41_2719 [Luteococcus japonicus]